MTAALRLELPDFSLPHIPAGGGSLWLRLPDAATSADEAALVSAALRAGVAIAPGRPYYCAEPPSAQVRLSFAAVAGAGEITEGVRRLRAACEKLFAASGPHHLSSGHD